jgi:hypothetical protein
MGGLRSVQSVAFGQINMPKDLRIGKRCDGGSPALPVCKRKNREPDLFSQLQRKPILK